MPLNAREKKINVAHVKNGLRMDDMLKRGNMKMFYCNHLRLCLGGDYIRISQQQKYKFHIKGNRKEMKESSANK